MISSVNFYQNIPLNQNVAFKANVSANAYSSNPINLNFDSKGMETLANYNKYFLVDKNKNTKFDDVFNEMMKNIPDSTTTQQEKELALSYIDKLLSCDDITPELKNYWSNKKEIIQMEIKTIQNEELCGNNENLSEIAKDWELNINKYWNKNPIFESVPDRVEYYRSYYNMYISFCDRVLACKNLPDNERAEWAEMKKNALFDLKGHERDLKLLKQK